MKLAEVEPKALSIEDIIPSDKMDVSLIMTPLVWHAMVDELEKQSDNGSSKTLTEPDSFHGGADDAGDESQLFYVFKWNGLSAGRIARYFFKRIQRTLEEFEADSYFLLQVATSGEQSHVGTFNILGLRAKEISIIAASED